MGFQEWTDEPWAFMAPLLPPKAKTSRSRVDDRKVLKGDPVRSGHRLAVER